MNATNTQPLGADFPKQVVEMLLKTIDESTKRAYRMIWDQILKFITEHWGLVIIALISILLLVILNYLITRRWGMLGSVLYHYLYFGILFLISLIFGPEVFANDWFKIVLVLVYIVCFVAVGKLLKKAGIKR